MKDFVFLLRSSPDAVAQAMGTPERAQKSLEIWLDWLAQLERDGLLKSPGLPLDRTGKVVRADAEQAQTDGPFLEAKDMVIGFIVVQARDLAHAVELAEGCPIARGGAVEVRPVSPLP